MIDNARPHLIMLDYRFSGEECIALFMAIKTHYPYLPIVAMSCNSNINDVYDKEDLDDYIPKPFDLELLFEVLRKYIRKN